MGSMKAKRAVRAREMREEDIDGVLAIDHKIEGRLRAMTYADTPSNYLGGQLDISIVAETEAGELVGFVLGRIVDSAYSRDDTGWMQLIGVDPEYRHQNIGSRLMQAFFEHCRDKGIKRVITMVNWHDWWMLSFLDSLGYTQGEMVEYVMQL